MDGNPFMMPQVNPLMGFGAILAGAGQGNMLGGFQAANQMQQAAQRNALLRQEMMLQMAEFQREQARRAALSRAATAYTQPLLSSLAPDVAEERRKVIEPIAQVAPELIMGPALTRMGFGKPTAQWRPMTAEERKAYGIPASQGAQINTVTGQVQTPGAAQTVVMGPGGIPTGFQRRPEPTSPTGTALVPEPGGPEDVKRREGMITLQGVYDDITELEALVKEHGTEAFGDTARRMAALRNRIIGNIPAVRMTGVLQEGELARMEQEIPKGESLTKPGFMVLPALSGFREEVGRTLEAKRRVYGMPEEQTTALPAPTGTLPIVHSDDDATYESLAPGTRFRDETGKEWVKP